MSITRCTKKPIAVRMCGPWADTEESDAEISAFTGAENWAVHPRTRQAEVWDKLHSTWVKVELGQYVVEGVAGEYYPIDPKVREDTYDVEDATQAPADTAFTAGQIANALAELDGDYDDNLECSWSAGADGPVLRGTCTPGEAAGGDGRAVEWHAIIQLGPLPATQ